MNSETIVEAETSTTSSYNYNVKYLTDEGWKTTTIRATSYMAAKTKAIFSLPDALEIVIF